MLLFHEYMGIQVRPLVIWIGRSSDPSLWERVAEKKGALVVVFLFGGRTCFNPLGYLFGLLPLCGSPSGSGFVGN